MERGSEGLSDSGWAVIRLSWVEVKAKNGIFLPAGVSLERVVRRVVLEINFTSSWRASQDLPHPLLCPKPTSRPQNLSPVSLSLSLSSSHTLHLGSLHPLHRFIIIFFIPIHSLSTAIIISSSPSNTPSPLHHLHLLPSRRVNRCHRHHVCSHHAWVDSHRSHLLPNRRSRRILLRHPIHRPYLRLRRR